MSRPTCIQPIVCMASFAALANAQMIVVDGPTRRSAQEFSQLVKNSYGAQVRLRMDRTEYFPGEDAELTIEISNAGSSAVEIFQPFEPFSTAVDLFQCDPVKPKEDPKACHRLNLRERVDLERDAATVWIHAGQPLTKKYVMSNPTTRQDVNSHGRPGVTICSICYIPEEEGEYQWRYDYGSGGRVDFKVVLPQLEQWTQVKFEKPGQTRFPDQGKLRTIVFSRLIRFAALGYQGSHILVVSLNAKASQQIRVDPTGRFTGDVISAFSPFKRIALSAAPITSLQATADSGENITLDYTDQTGRAFRLKLNANRDLVR